MSVRRVVLYVVIALVTAVVFVETSMLFLYAFEGYSYGVPTGYSMEPAISHNDFVVYEDVDGSDTIQEGDIIQFQEYCDVENSHVVHEVVTATEDGLVTKGVNNTVVDQYGGCHLPRKNVEGKIVFVAPNPVCDIRGSWNVISGVCTDPQNPYA